MSSLFAQKSSETTASDTFCAAADEVIKKERDRIFGPDHHPQRMTGIAFSGGGIRSACFSLGVVHALLKARDPADASRPLLARFHYLSTVSGGGYLGASLAWLRHLARIDKPADACAQLAAFEMQLDRSPPASLVGKSGNGNRWLDYLRQHGNYLLPPGITLLTLISVILRCMVTGIVTYGLLLIAVLGVLAAIGVLPGPALLDARIPSPVPWTASSLFIVATVLLVSSYAVYALATWINSIVNRVAALAAATAVLLAMIAASLAMIDATFFPSVLQLPDWWRFTLPSFAVPMEISQALWSGLTAALVLASLLSISLWTAKLWSMSTRATQKPELPSDKRVPAAAEPTGNHREYRIRLRLQSIMGWMLAIVIATGVLASLQPVADLLKGGFALSASVLGALSTLAGIYQALKGRGDTIAGRRGLPAPILIAVCGVILYGLVLIAYLLVPTMLVVEGFWTRWCWIGAIALALAVLNNLNYLSFGRVYRDRLMETFMPTAEGIEGNRWSPAVTADDFSMAEAFFAFDSAATPPPAAPRGEPWLYPLVNTTCVMVDSAVDRYRNRGGDSFVLSPLWCGSDATGWQSTARFADGKLTYASAMATSAAAANPNAGSNGTGITRDRLVAMLMYLFQARLGLWVVNPRRDATGDPSTTQAPARRLGIRQRLINRVWGQHPNLLVPGLLSGLLGKNQSEESAYLELTDGGHFDNTGLYELLRRKLRVIFVAQGGADPKFALADLSNAIRRAQVDFGVQIEFLPGFGLDQLLPEAAEPMTALRYSRRGFAVARIHYGGQPPKAGDESYLVYIQATRLDSILKRPGKEAGNDPSPPASVLGYALANQQFPNQTTADQFFDEAQVEAYRELGYYSAKQALATLGLLQDVHANVTTGTSADAGVGLGRDGEPADSQAGSTPKAGSPGRQRAELRQLKLFR